MGVRTPLAPRWGWFIFHHLTHGLRRGLYSFAASRLENPALFHPECEKRDLTHTLAALPNSRPASDYFFSKIGRFISSDDADSGCSAFQRIAAVMRVRPLG